MRRSNARVFQYFCLSGLVFCSALVALAKIPTDLTGPFCTSRREREFTRRTAGYAHQEVQSRTDRDDTASD